MVGYHRAEVRRSFPGKRGVMLVGTASVISFRPYSLLMSGLSL